MAMQHLEGEPRATDNSLFHKPKEGAPTETRRFSDEAHEALIKEGYIIYTLSGESIRSLRESNRKFATTWHSQASNQGLEAKVSIHSEVAISPDAIFIRNSNNMTLKQQEGMIAKFSDYLAKKIQGVEAVMGEVPDYAELAFTHLDATGERLFGKKYGYNWARTKTPTFGNNVAILGNFDATYGLYVRNWLPGSGGRHNFAAPLVVPKT